MAPVERVEIDARTVPWDAISFDVTDAAVTLSVGQVATIYFGELQAYSLLVGLGSALLLYSTNPRRVGRCAVCGAWGVMLAALRGPALYCPTCWEAKFHDDWRRLHLDQSDGPSGRDL